MLNRMIRPIMICAIVLLTAGSASATIYTTTYADPTSAPIYGTMIGPSGYYAGDTGIGAAAMPGGNALDKLRVYMWDTGIPKWSPFQMLKWDMGFATDFVRVYPDVEHNGSLDWDYLQWSLWGSNTGDETAGAWTLLWDPISSSGNNVNNFVVSGSGTAPTTVYRYGSAMGLDAWDDAFTMDFHLPTSYQYFGTRVSTLAYLAGHADPELDALATVPVPGAILLGILGLSVAGVKLRKFA